MHIITNRKDVKAELISPILSVVVKPEASGELEENVTLSLRLLKVILLVRHNVKLSICNKWSDKQINVRSLKTVYPTE